MNIQIGEKKHKDGEIDNPEFYNLAIKIHKEAREHNERIYAMKRAEQAEIERKNKEEQAKYITISMIIVLMCWALMYSCSHY